MGLRGLYDQIARTMTPVVADVTRMPAVSQTAVLVGGLTKTVRGEVDKLAARAWRAVNLPAGTDLERLQKQFGALDREIRLLRLELERERKEARRRGVTAQPEHD